VENNKKETKTKKFASQEAAKAQQNQGDQANYRTIDQEAST